MADDKTKRGSPDNKRLNKGEPYEVAYARKKAKASSGGSAGRTGAKRAGPAARKPPTRTGRARAAAAPAARKRSAPKEAVRPAPHPPTEKRTPENTAPRTMKTSDAVDLLTDDHLAVTALFQRYERLAKRDGGAAERRALAQQVCAMLKVHTQIEEELFYPAARAGGIDADMLDEAKVEHATAKDLIAQIESGNPDDDLYDARVTVLREYIQHHVVEEHTEMFPKCRRSAIDLVALRGELEARKASLEPAGATTAEPEQPKEEPGLLSRLSDKLFSSADDKGESGSGSRG